MEVALFFSFIVPCFAFEWLTPIGELRLLLIESLTCNATTSGYASATATSSSHSLTHASAGVSCISLHSP